MNTSYVFYISTYERDGKTNAKKFKNIKGSKKLKKLLKFCKTRKIFCSSLYRYQEILNKIKKYVYKFMLILINHLIDINTISKSSYLCVIDT